MHPPLFVSIDLVGKVIDNKLENDHLSSGNLLVGENRSGKLQLKRVSVKGQVVKASRPATNEFVVFVLYFTRALALALTVSFMSVNIFIHNYILKVFKEVVFIITFY